MRGSIVIKIRVKFGLEAVTFGTTLDSANALSDLATSLFNIY